MDASDLMDQQCLLVWFAMALLCITDNRIMSFAASAKVMEQSIRVALALVLGSPCDVAKLLSILPGWHGHASVGGMCMFSSALARTGLLHPSVEGGLL